MDKRRHSEALGGGSTRNRVYAMERGLGIVASRYAWIYGVQLSILGAETPEFAIVVSRGSCLLYLLCSESNHP